MYQKLFQPCFVYGKPQSTQLLTFYVFVGKSKFKKMRFGSQQMVTIRSHQKQGEIVKSG